jgi:N-acetylglucosamine transport system permease protein
MGAAIYYGMASYRILYIAGINRIPQYLYESTTLDGAGPIRQFFLITLPLIWEVVRVTITFL